MKPWRALSSLALFASGYILANPPSFAEETFNLAVMHSRSDVNVIASGMSEDVLNDVNVRVVLVGDGQEILRYEGPVWVDGSYVLASVKSYLVSGKVISLGSPFDRQVSSKSDFSQLKLAYHVAPFSKNGEREISLDDNVLDVNISPLDLVRMTWQMNQRESEKEGIKALAVLTR